MDEEALSGRPIPPGAVTMTERFGRVFAAAILAAAIALPLTTLAQSACFNQQNDLLMMNDMNHAMANGQWPMIPTGIGGGATVDLRGPIIDFKVLSDNGGLLDCTLLLIFRSGQQAVRIRYWKNIAGQMYYEVSFVGA